MEQSHLDEVLAFIEMARPPRRRTVSEWVEQEIILPPTGPYKRQPFLMDRQPWTRHWFWAIDSGRWTEFDLSGPSQSGKTLSGFVALLCYYLFEMGETVILGVPNMDMATDKWEKDIKPVIEATRYKDLLPVKGPGSRGAMTKTFNLRNGASIRWMTYEDSEKAVAGFTARVVFFTEVNAAASVKGGSEEGDRIAQIRARTNSFGMRARIFMECTQTTTEGRIYKEIAAGTDSRLALHCPHCHHYVQLERKHLVGWKDAEDARAALDRSSYMCPDCQCLWSTEDRVTANLEAVLVHKGQTVRPDGTVEGPEPRALTFGMTYTAPNNLFTTAGMIGRDEWAKEHSDEADEDAKERALCQFQWGIPYQPGDQRQTKLKASDIMARQDGSLARGEVPEWCEATLFGCDIGKWLGHWVVIAFGEGARCHVVDYGRIEFPADTMGEEQAILTGLRAFRDETLVQGWGGRQVDACMIDSRYQGDQVKAFCRESGPTYWPTAGYGATQRGAFVRYTHPGKKGPNIQGIGLQYHVVKGPPPTGYRVVNVNADFWKSFVDARWRTPMGEPGSMSLFKGGDKYEHIGFCKHQTSEHREEEFVPERGTVTVWRADSPNNHHLDATAIACAGSYGVGIRLNGPTKTRPEHKARPAVTPQAPARDVPEPQYPQYPQQAHRFTTPDGRPFLVTERN